MSQPNSAPRMVVRRYDPAGERRRKLQWILAWAASLVVLYLVCKFTMTPGYFRTQAELQQTRSQLTEAQDRNETLQDEVARLTRREQVADKARKVLEASLAESRTELAGLRSELAFYEKVVSGGADQAGLAINDLVLVPTEDPRIYRFVVTLSQNLKKDRLAKGRLELAVSGVRNTRMERLDYAALTGGATDAGQMAFSFKYFQRVEGTLMLPAGFAPDQVRVEADGSDGTGRVVREFAWTEGLKPGLTAG